MVHRLLRTQLKPFLYTLSGAIFAGVISDLIVRVATFDGNVESLTIVRFAIIYLVILLISGVIAVFAYNYPEDPIKYFSLKQRVKNKKLKIGIFNDIPWTDTDENHSWNNIKPEIWLKKYQEKFNQKNVEVEFVTIEANFDEYDVLLNPYGGVYKDTDLDKRPVLNRILDFVKTGGVYLNVSDTPFYYTFREELGYRVESRIQGIYLGHPFPGQITPLTRELNFYCTQHIQVEVNEKFSSAYDNLEKEDKPIIKMFRFSPLDGTGLESIYEPLTYQNKQYTSLFFVPYGNGHFLVSLLPFYLSEDNDINSDYLARWLDVMTDLSLTKLSKHKNLP